MGCSREKLDTSDAGLTASDTGLTVSDIDKLTADGSDPAGGHGTVDAGQGATKIIGIGPSVSNTPLAARWKLCPAAIAAGRSSTRAVLQPGRSRAGAVAKWM